MWTGWFTVVDSTHSRLPSSKGKEGCSTPQVGLPAGFPPFNSVWRWIIPSHPRLHKRDESMGDSLAAGCWQHKRLAWIHILDRSSAEGKSNINTTMNDLACLICWWKPKQSRPVYVATVGDEHDVKSLTNYKFSLQDRQVLYRFEEYISTLQTILPTMLENILCVRDVYQKWCLEHSPLWDHLGLLVEFDEHISDVKRDIQRVEVLKKSLQATIRLVCSVLRRSIQMYSSNPDS